MSKGRRGKGEGSIYWNERKKRWEAVISLGYKPNGRRNRKTVTGRTKSEVQARLTQLKIDRHQGISVEPTRMTVQDHLNEWLRRKKPNVRSGTYLRYKAHAKYIRHLGHIKLRDLTYQHISGFYAELDDGGDLSPRYIFDIHSTLRSCLKDAVEHGLIPSNPATKVKRTYQKKEARFLTQEELKWFLVGARGERLEDAFIFAVHTGLRPGEWLGLSWDDVDLDKARVSVRQALHEEGANLFLGPPKTEAAMRTISISDKAIAALRRQSVRQAKSRLMVGPHWSNQHNLVFANRDGNFLRRTNIQRRDLVRIIETAKTAYRDHLLREKLARTASEADRRSAKLLEGVTLHSLRHTHASALIFQGADIKTVQRRLGHERVEYTLNLYGHLLPGQDERAAALMDDYIQSL